MYRVSLLLVEKSMIENSVQIFTFKIGIKCKSSVSSLIMYSRFLLLFYVLFERLHKKLLNVLLYIHGPLILP